MVVLPAPFGPSSANSSPRATYEREARRGRSARVRLAQARTAIASASSSAGPPPGPSPVIGRRSSGTARPKSSSPDLADLDRPDDPVAIDEVRLRRRDDAGTAARWRRPDRRRVGQSRPNSPHERRAGPVWSLYSTPTIARPSGPSSARRLLDSSGNSSRHGPHQLAQKFTTTGRPRSAARSKGWPSSVVPVIGGAGWPTLNVIASRGRRTMSASATAPSRTSGTSRRTRARVVGPPSAGGQRARHVRVDRAHERVGRQRRAPGHRRPGPWGR